MGLWLCSTFKNSIQAQENLVPNGSFEEYYNCPSYAEGFYINACKYWTSPTLGSPDYLNACSVDFDSSLNTYLFSVPQNAAGNQFAEDGDAYAFLYLGQTDNYSQPAYCEYIQIELVKPLEEGKLYNLKFYAHNPGIRCTNTIGVLFSQYEINEQHQTLIQSEPQFMSDSNMFFCDTNKWYELNYTFFSDGSERYMTIGLFKEGSEINQTDYQGNILLNENIEALFYIDNVSLNELDFALPNVFTPNNDDVNDYFSFTDLSKTLEKLTILNRWGSIVYQSDDVFFWDGKHQQTPCADGVYYYILEFKQYTKKTGFVHLIR